MRVAHPSFLLSAIWLSSASQALTLDCERIKAGDAEFNLEKLGGPRTVHYIDPMSKGVGNTTFTIDLCEALKKDPDVDPKEQCQSGTRICASRSFLRDGKEKGEVEDVWPIAGEFVHDGRHLEPKYNRLKNSDSNSDSDKEGLRIVLNGGTSNGGVKQKAVIELLCDRDKTGLEGPSGKEEKSERADDDGEGDGDKDKQPSADGDQSLQLVTYQSEPLDGKDSAEVGVLRLNWKTKYACEDQFNIKDPEDAKKSTSRGFFGWFVIILFLAIASYLIFGSWLNYNRYGARGWDLLPHGDTIRDLPYLIKDWGRKVVSTIQGSGGSGRGGYSAL